jgi:uncharacterized membrane protein
MGKTRLEAFSGGVIASLIPIMVRELKVPHGVTLDAVLPLRPVFLASSQLHLHRHLLEQAPI